MRKAVRDGKTAAARRTAKKYKPGSLPYVWNKVRYNKGAMAGLVILLLLVLLSMLSTTIGGYGVTKIDMNSSFQTPNAKHIFGTDDLGRDLFVRVLYGARYTLSIGICSVLISACVGIILGSIAGYFGGVWDSLVMRFLDVFQAFPMMLMAIVLAAVFGAGLDKCILALGISGAPNYARLIRANILTIRGQEYIEAATSINCSKARIIMKHVIPNAISPLIVTMSLGIANAGLSAASLSFLGLGIQQPQPEWGNMLFSARGFIRDYPHLVLIPGAFIMISVVCFNLIGDAIRDALDPKLKD